MLATVSSAAEARGARALRPQPDAGLDQSKISDIRAMGFREHAVAALKAQLRTLGGRVAAFDPTNFPAWVLAQTRGSRPSGGNTSRRRRPAGDEQPCRRYLIGGAGTRVHTTIKRTAV